MATIFYYTNSITYDPLRIVNNQTDPDPTVFLGYGPEQLYVSDGLRWSFVVTNIPVGGTDIVFHWNQSITTYMNGTVKGFAKSATLHFIYRQADFLWDFLNIFDPPIEPQPSVDLYLEWPNFSLFIGKGLFDNVHAIHGPDKAGFTINVPHAVVYVSGVTSEDDLMDLQIPVDLSLQDQLPTLRLHFDGVGANDGVIRVQKCYFEIDWEVAHGFSYDFALPTSGNSRKIFTRDGYNPSTGAFSLPTTGNSITLKTWGSPSDANARAVFALVTESH